MKEGKKIGRDEGRKLGLLVHSVEAKGQLNLDVQITSIRLPEMFFCNSKLWRLQ